MSTGVDIIEPVTDTRSARQVSRDTRKHEAMARKRLTSKGATIAALVIAIFWTIPTFGLFVTSLRPGSDVQSTGWWTVFTDPSFTLENYQKALTSGGTALTLGQSFLNSLAITIPVVFFALAVASLLAYAFAWIDFKGRNLAFIAVFALQIVPLQMALVPLLSLFSRGMTIGDVTVFPALDLRGLEHSFATVWIAHTIFALPLAVFLLHNFIAEIPSEVIEAATTGKVAFCAASVSASSSSFQTSTKVKTSAPKSEGAATGREKRQKISAGPQPSMAAASSMFCGTRSKAGTASQITVEIVVMR